MSTTIEIEKCNIYNGHRSVHIDRDADLSIKFKQADVLPGNNSITADSQPLAAIAIILGLDGENTDLLSIDSRLNHRDALLALQKAVAVALDGLDAA